MPSRIWAWNNALVSCGCETSTCIFVFRSLDMLLGHRNELSSTYRSPVWRQQDCSAQEPSSELWPQIAALGSYLPARCLVFLGRARPSFRGCLGCWPWSVRLMLPFPHQRAKRGLNGEMMHPSNNVQTMYPRFKCHYQKCSKEVNERKANSLAAPQVVRRVLWARLRAVQSGEQYIQDVNVLICIHKSFHLKVSALAILLWAVTRNIKAHAGMHTSISITPSVAHASWWTISSPITPWSHLSVAIICKIHFEGPSSNLMFVKVPHGTLCSRSVEILAKRKSFQPAPFFFYGMF